MQIDWVIVFVHTTHNTALKMAFIYSIKNGLLNLDYLHYSAMLCFLSTVKIVRDLNAQPKIQPYTVSNEQLRKNYRELLSSRYLSIHCESWESGRA